MATVRIYLDENVNPAVSDGLRRRGIDSWTVRDAGRCGEVDDAQLAYATEQGAVIVSHDDDYLRLALAWAEAGKSHGGIAYAAMGRHPIGQLVMRVASLAASETAESARDTLFYL